MKKYNGTERGLLKNLRAQLRRRTLIKEAAINIYSNGEACCSWCKQADIDMLCLDHINDDGATHRKKLGNNKYWMYEWLMKHDYPDGLQVLCFNCNRKKQVEAYRRVTNDRYQRFLQSVAKSST